MMAQAPTLSNQQSDALLDVVEQCWLLGAAWEGHQASISTGRKASQGSKEQGMAADAETAWKQARNDLTDFYLIATELGVTDDTLCEVLDRNLPPELLRKFIEEEKLAKEKADQATAED